MFSQCIVLCNVKIKFLFDFNLMSSHEINIILKGNIFTKRLLHNFIKLSSFQDSLDKTH